MSNSDWFPFQSYMNLLLINHPSWSKRNLLKNSHTQYRFNEDNLYICLSGLKKSIYTDVLGMETMEYVDLFYSMDLDALLQTYGYTGNAFFLFNDGSKRIVLLFSPTEKTSVTPLKLAENITEYIQSFYEERLFHGCTHYPNTSSLVSVEHGFDGLQNAFTCADALHELSFFVTEPTVFTDSWRTRNVLPLDFQNLINLLREFDAALLNKDTEKTRLIFQHLFMDKLKKSASRLLCRDALLYLKSTYELYFTVYEIDRLHDLDTLFSLSAYSSIEACKNSLSGLLDELLSQMALSPITSEFVMRAIYYIRHHFCDAALSLTDISHYANANQNYLSSLFKQQTGLSIRQFITSERLKKAASLLSDTELSIQDISLMCGFLDAKYFAQVFRTHTTQTPQTYRREKTGGLPEAARPEE